MRALIDGQEVDVALDELPAFTFSVEDTLDIGAARGARSTTMTLPMTNRNRRIIGGQAIGEGASSSKKFSVRSGTASYFDGICFVRGIDSDSASVVAVGDNAVWMALLNGQKLRDLQLGYVDSQSVDNAIVNDSWDGSKPYVFPLIDYGPFEGRAPGYDVSPSLMHPALFVSYAIRNAFSAIGYGIDGAGSFKDTWRKLIMPPVNGPVYVRQLLGSSDPDNPASAEATVDVSAPPYQPTIFGGTPNIYRYGTASGGNSPGSIAASGTYTAPTGGFSGSVAARFYYGEDFNPAFDNITFVAVLWNQTTGQLIQARTMPRVTPSVASTHVAVFNDIVIPEGQVAFAAVQSITASPVFPNIAPSMNIAWGHVRELQESSTGLTEIDLAAILPDIGVLDLIGWIMRAFCVVPVTNGSFVELWHYDELYPPTPNQSTTDITGRQKGVPFKDLEEIPNTIVFEHEVDDGDRALDTISAGRFSVRIDVGGSAGQQSITVGYSPTAMKTVMDLRIPAMRSRNSEISGGFYPEQLQHRTRLLLYEGLKPGSWTLNGQALTQYPSAISYGDGSTTFGSVHFKDRPRQIGTVTRHWLNRLTRWTAPRLKVDAVWHDHEVAGFRASNQVKANDGSVDGLYYVMEINQHRFGMGEPSETTLVPL